MLGALCAGPAHAFAGLCHDSLQTGDYLAENSALCPMSLVLWTGRNCYLAKLRM